jgi:hypothetical protein
MNPLLLSAADATQKQDAASVVAVISVFVVMLALFGVLILLAFRTAGKGRRTWTDE